MKNKIQQDLTESIKSNNTDKTRALRGLILAIQVLEKSSGQTLTDDNILNIINKCIKQREESFKIFNDQNRIDLAVKEQEELKYLREFLPPQLSIDELEILVTQYVDETLAVEPNIHQGKLLGGAIKKFSTVADRNSITEVVNTLLKKV